MIRMNKQTLSRSCIAIGICMLMGSAWAQDAEPKAAAPAAAPTAAVQGSAAAGQKIAQSGTPQGAAACATCHGAKGEG
ncbi:cytochrome C, partial [Delftia tsuruhatensis]